MSISYVQNGDSGLVARTLINQAIDGVNTSTLPYTGSAKITGSLEITGSTISTLGFTGSLLGTASYASQALSSTSSSYALTASNTISSSYALTASYALNGGGGGVSFPYTGSAIITGSLIVTGSTTSTLGFTGSLLGTANKVLITDSTSSAAGLRSVFVKDIATGLTVIDSTGPTYTPTTKTYSGEANYNITSGSISLTGSLKLNGGGIAAGSGIMYTDATSGESVVSNTVQFTATTTTITGGSRGTMNLANLGIGGGGNGLIIPTTIPNTPNTGSMYVDFGASKLYLYSGTAWLSSSLA